MVVTEIEGVTKRLQGHSPRRKWYRKWLPRSAVALILRQTESGLETLMIKRAEHPGGSWSGHMAFPGGRAEVGDRDTLHTARRETWEEIGLDTQRYTRCVGRLSDVLTRPRMNRKPMVITPYLFTIEVVPDLVPNYEVAEVVWVPLMFLADRDNRQLMQWQGNFRTRDLPCYFYQERCIWGLSLIMLDELVETVKL